jgi:hypothetical protein
MNRTQRALTATAAATVLAGSGLAAPVSAGARHRAPADQDLRAVTARIATAAGLQTAVKHTRRPTVRIAGRRYPAPNPFLAQVLDGSSVDWSYWHRLAERRGQQRAKGRTASRAVPTPVAYDEQEPGGSRGGNDTRAGSEHIANVGIGRAFQAVRVQGRLSNARVRYTGLRSREEQGSIPRATRTGIDARRSGVLVTSRIGDGAHGSRGGGSGDFDFYRLRVTKGKTLSVDTRGSTFDTVAAVYDRSGRIIAANDDARSDLSSFVRYEVPRTGYYYVMVSGFGPGPVPTDPFRPGSGAGAGAEGRYRLKIAVRQRDKDYYGFRLESGDVLGGRLAGGATKVGVARADGRRMVTSTLDASFIYPPQSPLPGGGAAFAYVAEQPGWYAVSATEGAGDYRMLVETYRPGTERAAAGPVQTVYLDFDGERLNTGIFGGGGVRTLSPLRSFLSRWGLRKGEEPELVDAIVASVEESLARTVAEQGLNPDVAVRVLDSRHDPDPWGQPNVSRVVVGGTIAQSGVPTIGIAQSIDPGNYASEETALVLLDKLSERARRGYSLNTYLRPRSDRVAFVGQAVGNVVSHEVGHMVGSFHTDNSNRTANLMDAGGTGFARLFGVGRDRVGGTADDRDVDFGEDRFALFEAFEGIEDTLNTTAWAFRPGTAP